MIEHICFSCKIICLQSILLLNSISYFEALVIDNNNINFIQNSDFATHCLISFSLQQKGFYLRDSVSFFGLQNKYTKIYIQVSTFQTETNLFRLLENDKSY